MRALGIALAMVLVTASLGGAGESVDVSVGYAFAQYLQEGGGSAPVGVFASIAKARGTGLEADVAYHRDVEGGVAQNTFVGAAGPRVNLDEGERKPFLHLMGAVRYDSAEGSSDTSFGAVAGGGIDLPAGDTVTVRLGADFQIFFEKKENLKVLRLNVGLTF